MISFNLFIIFAISVYLLWAVYSYEAVLLKKARIENSFSGFDFFDTLLKSTLSALFLARLGWLALNIEHVRKIGFGFLPYIKVNGIVSWFMYYPWRFLVITEGVNMFIFKIIITFLLILGVFWPMFEKARELFNTTQLKGIFIKLLVLITITFILLVGTIWIKLP